MSFFKTIGKIGKGLGGVALGIASPIVSTATGGLVNPKGIIDGMKSSSVNNVPMQTVQGANIDQPAQTGSKSWFQGFMDTLVTGVNSMNPRVTVTADQSQVSQGKNWLLIGGAALAAILLLNNSNRRR